MMEIRSDGTLLETAVGVDGKHYPLVQSLVLVAEAHKKRWRCELVLRGPDGEELIRQGTITRLELDIDVPDLP